MGISNGRTKSKGTLYLGITAAIALSAGAIIDHTGIYGLACLGLAAIILLVSMLLR